ncbi:MAG: hypothetical protein SGCHY_003603 [Lobulomycetales sp.]
MTLEHDATPTIRLGDLAPNFKAETTQGAIDFHSWKEDSWAVLCSHPADFTPVCTTELGAIAKLKEEWAKRSVKVAAVSCNELSSHEKWVLDIEETQGAKVEFPIIADAKREIAQLYGMLDKQDLTNIDQKGLPMTVRSVFIIDPKNVIRLIITYPAAIGRNFDEIFRVLDGLFLVDEHKVATPCNWKKGDVCALHFLFISRMS